MTMLTSIRPRLTLAGAAGPRGREAAAAVPL